jgi:predicted phosphohydrolase
MKIFAIGDTHLSGEPPFKPMHIFGDHWLDHWQKIQANWLAAVEPEDIVLLPGDLSWAMKLEDALPDLTAIAALPGQKFLIRGNHDYWWQTLAKLQRLCPPSLHFIQNNYYELPELNLALCGTRGWIVPSDPGFTEADQAIYDREIGRLRASLQAARTAAHDVIITLLHYPPLMQKDDSNGFLDLLDEFAVKHCIYGHLHDKSIEIAFTGRRHKTEFHLVSCDALNFKLKRIM